MASVINAVRNITGDSMWIPKIFLLTVVVFFIFNMYTNKTYDEQSMLIMSGIILCFFIGIGSFLCSAVIKNKVPSLPGIQNILTLLKKSVLCTSTMIPFSLILWSIINFINVNVQFQETYVYWIVVVIISVVFSPFILIPPVLYSVRDNLVDGFNYNNIFKSSGNFIVSFLSFCIQFLIVFLCFFLIWRIAADMTSSNPFVFSVLYSFFSVSSLLILFSFLADCYGESINEIKIKN